MRSRPPRIDGFILGKILGSGPTSTVYAATESRGNNESGRVLAIKILHPNFRDDETHQELIRREAFAGKSIRHRNVVRVLAAGEFHIVMELLNGVSLRSELDRHGRIHHEAVVGILRQTALALNTIHSSGFVHGDVKPDNLHLCDSRTIKLLDLGFTHRPGEIETLLGEGNVLGTANYIAPELCIPTADDGPYNDVFSLGVSAYEMLTGTLPYPEGDVEQTMIRHRDDEPMLLSRWRGPWSPTLSRLIDSMMVREPRERPTATRIARELTSMETNNQRRIAA
jgi:eukaryotic-like serine/threonine-protein kinase